MELTYKEYELLSSLIYNKIGIRFEAKKIYFLSKRIHKRMAKLGFDSAIDYIRFIRHLDTEGKEIQELYNLLTINETYFFRDYGQLQSFAEHCLPQVVDKKAANSNKTIRIWSAGCSTGEEAYSIAIILLEMIDDFQDWDIRILATDIDKEALLKAGKAIYSSRSVKDIPEEYLDKYFYKSETNKYMLLNNIKGMVTFEHHNLANRLELRKKRGFDFIFCRNVLIYFDEVSRKKVVDHFYIALNKGSFIFLGSSESVGRVNTAYKMKKAGNTIVYFKE